MTVKNKIEPIFTALSDDALLSKCLQNNNESLNSVVWKRYPKDVYVGRNVLEIGVSSAVININNGANDMISLLKELTPELFTELYSKKRDTSRIKVMNRKSFDETKTKTIMCKKKGI